jgi:hypothetical protein
MDYKRLEYLEKLLDNANLPFEKIEFIYERLGILTDDEVNEYIKYLREEGNQKPSLDEEWKGIVGNEMDKQNRKAK